MRNAVFVALCLLVLSCKKNDPMDLVFTVDCFACSVSYGFADAGTPTYTEDNFTNEQFPLAATTGDRVFLEIQYLDSTLFCNQVTLSVSGQEQIYATACHPYPVRIEYVVPRSKDL